MLKKYLNTQNSLLFTILIIAAFFRFYNIMQLPPGLYPDEAMNGNNALEALLPAGHFKVFYPENNGREGLFINIQALSIWIFGNEPWALRVVSAIFGMLTILGVYFLAKELFTPISNSQFSISNSLNTNRFENWKLKIKNSEIALLSSFLLAISFWHINFSRIGFRAISAPFYIVWSIYFLLKSFRSMSESKPPKFYILNSIFSGIFLGLGFHSYIAFRTMPALILIVFSLKLLAFREKWREIVKIFFIFVFSSAVIFAPLAWYFLKNPQDFFGRTAQVSIFHSVSPLKSLGLNILKTAGMFFVSGDFNWRHNYAGQPELYWPVAILFAIGIFTGLYFLFKKKEEGQIPIALSQNSPAANLVSDSGISTPQSLPAQTGFKISEVVGASSFPFWILFFGLFFAALPVVVSNEGIPHALRSVLLIPFVFILAGAGGILFCEFIKSKVSNATRSALNIPFFVICLLLIFQAYANYFVMWGKNPNVEDAFAADYARLGYELRVLPNELPKWVVVETEGVDVRGIPMPAQTVMFLTDTFTKGKQDAKNLHYFLPGQIDVSNIPGNVYVTSVR